jgi:endogenous inhibitor of DNA gyrase (YacG/DUF329 family)
MASARTCVYCRKRPVEPRWTPFCSERCKLLDLAAWAEGRYRIPGEEVPPETDAGPPQEPTDE